MIDKITIGYKLYDVVEVPNLHNEDGDLYGRINYMDETIELLSGMSDRQRECTILHECIHGLDEIYSIGLEEKQVGQLACGIYKLLLDNHDMFERRKND